MLGDMRWGGLYGVDVDFVALENCKLLSISEETIQARALRTGHGASSSSCCHCRIGFCLLCTPSTVCIPLQQQAASSHNRLDCCVIVWLQRLLLAD